MIGNLSGQDAGWIGVILMTLFLFGIAFNALVGYAERRSYMRGYVAFFVVLGVLVTLGGAALIDWRGALIVLATFIASGTPMLFGSIHRHMVDREAELDMMRRDARREANDTTKEMAERR